MPLTKTLISASTALILLSVANISPVGAYDAPQSNKLTAYGYNLLKSGEIDAAINTFAKAIIADPSNLSPRRLLAKAEFQQGNVVECLKQLDAVASVQPDVVADLILSGQASMSLGKADLAYQKYQRALQKEPANTQAALGMVDILIARRDFAAAQRLCEQVLMLPHNSVESELVNQKLGVIQQCSQKPIQLKG